MKSGEVVAGRYQTDRRLGIGGMGEVWSAVHLGTGRSFAVKFMHAHAATSASARQRFTREARASARVNHPSVVDVFDVGELEDGTLFLVMQLLDGCSLADALHAVPPLTVQEFLTVIMETTDGIAAAHAAGIVHRDLKPANIFLHKDRTGLASPKVLDFGISKFADADDFSTKTGAVLGSPRYMSPEQTRSAAAADQRADIWALGVILFEGLTGTWPHDGDSFTSLVIAISTEPPKSIDAVAPMLPEPVRAIVRECLRPLDERLASATALAEMIARALDDPSLASVTLPKPQHASSEVAKTTTGVRVRPRSSSPGDARLPPGTDPRLRAAAIAEPYAGRAASSSVLPAVPFAPSPVAPSSIGATPPPPIADPPTVTLGDPLSQSLSTVNVETLAYEPRERGTEPPRAGAPVLPALPPVTGTSANRLRWIAAVLSVMLAAIVVALVSTIRRSSEDTTPLPTVNAGRPPASATASSSPSATPLASSTTGPSDEPKPSPASPTAAAPSAPSNAPIDPSAEPASSSAPKPAPRPAATPRATSSGKPRLPGKPDPGVFGSGLN